ncbi:MAG: chemotaxis protein [Okeania sp. SIO2H7]|nr:chemotaxis protein [Okeania sp. SIO2H7]
MTIQALVENMKIINRLKLTALVLLLAAIFNLGWVYSQIDAMTADARVVNFSGIVRGATQRLVKQELTGEKSQDLIDRLDKIVLGLREGDGDLGLPQATDDNYLLKIKAVENAWIELKQAIKNYRINVDTANEMLAASEDYWDLTNAAVFAAEDFSKYNVNRLKITQLMTFLIDVILLAIIGQKITESIKTRLIKTIHDISLASTELAATVEEQERVSHQQASAVHQTTASMDELRVTSKNCAEEAREANSAASEALNITKNGYQSVINSQKNLKELKAKMEAMQGEINLLKEQSDRINKISFAVSDLANATNLLALNASVEAVRAGKEGKGFAVVAQEIRKLADRSKESAREINVIIVDIKNAVNSLKNTTNKSTDAVEKNVEVADRSGKAFQSLAKAMDLVVVNNRQISLNTKQQAIAIKQVVEAMNSLKKGARETAAAIAQVRQGAEKLNEAAFNLRKVV